MPLCSLVLSGCNEHNLRRSPGACIDTRNRGGLRGFRQENKKTPNQPQTGSGPSPLPTRIPEIGRTEEDIARLQRWRREHNVMWVSELFRAGGITLRDRFMKNLAARARRCESGAIRHPALQYCVRTRPRASEPEQPAACRPSNPSGVGRCRRWQLRVARWRARPRTCERARWCNDRCVHRWRHATPSHRSHERDVHHERQRYGPLRLAAASG